jgi:hypothetical protein
MKTKQCAKCEKTKPIQEFNLRYTNSTSYQSRCKSCVVEDNRVYWLTNKKKMKKNYKNWTNKNPTHRKNNRLVSMYGITLDQYNQMVVVQNNKCAICKQPETVVDKTTDKTKELCVDHCHVTNKIRGLLCNSCNRGIGNLKDNPTVCRAASDYLIFYSNLSPNVNSNSAVDKAS